MQQTPTDLKLKKFSKKYNVSDFDCEEASINKFIQKEASAFQQERLGITYLAYLKRKLAGFVTISMADMKTNKMELNQKPPIEIENYPALQIGQLGVDRRFQRKGVGRLLVKWCVNKAIEYSESIGCRLLVLNAIPTSVDFYKKCNFIELKKQKNRVQQIMYFVIPKEMFNNPK